MNLLPNISMGVLVSILIYISYYDSFIKTSTVNECISDLELCISNTKLENYLNGGDCQYLINTTLQCWSNFYNVCLESLKCII